MTTPDPIEAAAEAMHVEECTSDDYCRHGADYLQHYLTMARAAAPILIAAGREEVADKISALVNAGWQVLRTTGAKDPILEAKLDALDEAAALARGGTS